VIALQAWHTTLFLRRLCTLSRG